MQHNINNIDMITVIVIITIVQSNVLCYPMGQG